MGWEKKTPSVKPLLCGVVRAVSLVEEHNQNVVVVCMHVSLVVVLKGGKIRRCYLLSRVAVRCLLEGSEG